MDDESWFRDMAISTDVSPSTHSSFRLRTSSNTPSVRKNVILDFLLPTSIEKYVFHIAYIVVSRSTWANRHNSKTNWQFGIHTTHKTQLAVGLSTVVMIGSLVSRSSHLEGFTKMQGRDITKQGSKNYL